jgi:nicotinate-nucleotide adenylyltransferase
LRRAGVLGGTFDPVHLGHLHVAQRVARVFDLERMILIPSSAPPHKDPATTTAAPHRLAMLRLATARRRGLEVGTVEIERGGVSYTIDTLRALRRGAAPVEPLFVLGMDAFLDLRSWREPDALLEQFDLVVVNRPGGPGREEVGPRLGRETVDRMVEVADGPGAGRSVLGEGRGGRVFHLVLPPVAIASRDVRSRAAAGLPLDGLVPPGVARYIRDRKLYRQEGRF